MTSAWSCDHVLSGGRGRSLLLEQFTHQLSVKRDRKLMHACVHLRLSQLTLIDMIIYGALAASGHSAVRWSRVLRPLLLVNVTEGRQVYCDARERRPTSSLLTLFF